MQELSLQLAQDMKAVLDQLGMYLCSHALSDSPVPGEQLWQLRKIQARLSLCLQPCSIRGGALYGITL